MLDSISVDVGSRKQIDYYEPPTWGERLGYYFRRWLRQRNIAAQFFRCRYMLNFDTRCTLERGHPRKCQNGPHEWDSKEGLGKSGYS